MLMIIDNYSPFAKLYGLQRKAASSVCKKIGNYSEMFGSPETMLSDGGLEFKNREMDLYATYGIKYKIITPYNPKGNGVVERVYEPIK